MPVVLYNNTMKKHINQLGEDESIIARDKEELNIIYNKLHELGYKWRNGKTYLEDAVNDYTNEGMVIYPYNGTYGSKYYAPYYYTIEEIADFDTGLPERWFVKPTTPEQHRIVGEYIDKHKEPHMAFIYANCPGNWGLAFPECFRSHLYHYCPEGYTELSFEEWQRRQQNKQNLHFILPQDWDKAVEHVRQWMTLKPEYKEGDYITVVKGCDGYNGEEGRTYRATMVDGDHLYYEQNNCIDTNRVIVRPATEEEIQKIKLPTIHGYEGIIKGNTISYGCKSFNIEDIETLHKLIERMNITEVDFGGYLLRTSRIGEVVSHLKQRGLLRS